ncbi:1-aminocyclopropane-1-carboxylate deaminase/D-cysteine desulfhydrase [Shewanella sp.]|uniref:1-aminocyclopropane-1-carboxylate deaminase/D-cysteine desulfhydrase n=1 Tax=Shewanella sp. TaxID=50422 RepID=UPI003A971A9F
MMKLSQTPVECHQIDNVSLFIKRDDLLHPAFSGNKARKFAYYLQQPFSHIKRVLGHGSVQANSLYSLASLAQLRGWQLDYYVNHIPQSLRDQPLGNYAAALAAGANIIDTAGKNGEEVEPMLAHLAAQHEDTLFIPEGGRALEAEFGVQQLAAEIATWWRSQQLEQLVVFLPAGTGTTALFLQKSFCEMQLPIIVMTCAVVGGDDYLRKQFYQLCANVRYHPTIVTPAKRYHFGKCYREFLIAWQQMNQTGIEFELLYDPLGWLCLKSVVAEISSPIVYIHQGGILGNQSMLPRYRRKYPELFTG